MIACLVKVGKLKCWRLVAAASVLGLVCASNVSLAACMLPGCEATARQDPGAALNSVYDSAGGKSMKDDYNTYARSAVGTGDLQALAVAGEESMNPYAQAVGRMGYDQRDAYVGMGGERKAGRRQSLGAGSSVSSTLNAPPSAGAFSPAMRGASPQGNW